jgi:allantoate deiminase
LSITGFLLGLQHLSRELGVLEISWNTHAARIQNRIDALAAITDEKGTIQRTFLSEATLRANKLVAGWMQEAGLATSEDRVGNVLGQSRSGPSDSIFLLGSHLDTVRNAGRYDGPLGVILGIEAAEIVRSANVSLPFALAVAGFTDEEGVRFQNAYLGSKAFCGLLTSKHLNIQDRDGLTLREIVERTSGPGFVLPGPAFAPGRLRGYLEVHMEQGPVLENEGLALGVVTAVAGQLRCRLTWTGKASHAGTTPGPLRRDALVGAAEFICDVEKASELFSGLVATVGRVTVQPNVSNVVPALVTHTLDVRHQSDSVLREASAWLKQRSSEVAAARRLGFAWEILQTTPARDCDAALSRKLLGVVETVTGSTRMLPSGAGHDAAILAPLYPVGMLFVRCRDGLSHHPDEFVSLEDISVALQVTVEFLRSWEGI